MKLKMSAIPQPRGNQAWDEADTVNDNKDKDAKNWFSDGKNWATGSSKPAAQPSPYQSSNKS